MQIGKVMGRQVYTNTGKELEMLRRFSERMIDEIYRGKISLSQANSSSCIGGHSLHNNECAKIHDFSQTFYQFLTNHFTTMGKVARKTLFVNGVKNILKSFRRQFSALKGVSRLENTSVKERVACRYNYTFIFLLYINYYKLLITEKRTSLLKQTLVL